MTSPTSDIAAGDVVRWISSNVYKQGVVEAVVPAGRTPADVGFPKAGGGGLARDHESYIVRGRKLTNRGEEYGSKALYWPHVSLLELPPKMEPVSAPSPWQPIETAPKDWEPVLVWAITEEEHDDAEDEDRSPTYGPVVAKHSSLQPGLWWMVGAMQKVYRPTHWMPLPEAPRRSGRGE